MASWGCVRSTPGVGLGGSVALGPIGDEAEKVGVAQGGAKTEDGLEAVRNKCCSGDLQ